jgi:hypothetical protein
VRADVVRERRTRAGAVAALMAAAALTGLGPALGGCAGNGGGADTEEPVTTVSPDATASGGEVGSRPATTTTEPPPVELRVELPPSASPVVVRADAPGEAPADAALASSVTGALTAYVVAATAEPAAGRPSTALDLLTPAAAARLDPAAADALADPGLPALASGTLAVPAARSTALIGPDGVTVVAAELTVVLEGVSRTGAAVRVERTGELTLVADPADPTRWRIDAFRFVVTRDLP